MIAAQPGEILRSKAHNERIHNGLLDFFPHMQCLGSHPYANQFPRIMHPK